MNRSNTKAAILIIIAACLWGTMPLSIKRADFDPLWTTWIRVVGNVVILFAFFHRSLLQCGRPRKLEVIIGGIFFLSLLTTTLGMKWTNSANAVVFTFISPFAGLVVGVMQGRRFPTFKECTLMGLLLVGVIAMNGGLSRPSLGDLLAIISGLLWGAAFPHAQSCGERFQVVVLWQQLLGVISIPFIAFSMNGSFIPPSVTGSQGIWLLCLASAGGFAYVLHVKATSTQTIEPYVNLSLGTFQIVSATLLGSLVLNEPFGILKLVGVMAIIGSTIPLIKKQ